MSEAVISDAVRYIGCDDHEIDLFESQYRVPNGVSYNSYLIVDEKIAIMDTVDARATEEWLANLERELDNTSADDFFVCHPAGSGAGPCRQYPEGLRKVSGTDGGGKCQDLCHAASVFYHGFQRPKNGGQGRGQFVSGPSYPALLYGSHGTLAGGHGDL